MKVYLDNDIVSAVTKRDHAKAELEAIDRVLSEGRAGTLSVGTSRHSVREIEDTPLKFQRGLKSGLAGLDIAADDHRLLEFNHQKDQYGGFITQPIVTDIVNRSLYDGLRADGLDDDDARHVMYAAQNGYERFLTCDKRIIKLNGSIRQRCPGLRVQRPSEFVAELPFQGSHRT